MAASSDEEIYDDLSSPDSDLFDQIHDEEDFSPSAQDVALPEYVKRMKRYCKEWTGSVYLRSLPMRLIWKYSFCNKYRIPIANKDKPFSPPPTLNHLRTFLQWQARRKKGRLDHKIIVRTLEKYWTELQLEIRRQTGHRYDAEAVRNIENVCTECLLHRFAY